MTNKTDKNRGTTRAGTQPQIELASTDTNPRAKYEIILCFIQHDRAKVVLEAKSIKEAWRKANDIEPDQIDDWNPIHGEISVASVQPVEGGQDHE